MKDFEYNDTSFDIFQEIVFENKVVGFVSYLNTQYNFEIIEAYIMLEFRGNNLLYYEIISKNDDIVVCELYFNSDSSSLKKSEDSLTEHLSSIYDLKHGSILYLDDELDYSTANSHDIEKYDLDLNISDEYLKDVREMILNNEEFSNDVLNTLKIEKHMTFILV